MAVENAGFVQEAVFAALDDALVTPTPAPETPKAEPDVTAATATEPPSVETQPEAAKTDTAGPPPQPPSEAPQTGPNYRDFLNKHKDPEAGAAHYWEITRQNAEMARRLKELEASPAPPAEPVAPEVHPQVAQYDTQLQTIEVEGTKLARTAVAYQTESKKYANAISGIDQNLASIQRQFWLGNLDVAREEELRTRGRELLTQKDQLLSQKQAYDNAVSNLNQQAGLLATKYELAQSMRSQAEMLSKLQMASEAEEQRRYDAQHQAEIAKDTADYKETYKALAAELQIPEKQQKRFANYIAGTLHTRVAELEAAGDEVGIPDMKAAMKELALDFKAALDDHFNERSADYTKKKTGQMTTEGPTGKAAVVTTLDVKRRPPERDMFESLDF